VKKKLALTAALIAIVACLAISSAFWPRKSISEESCEKIQIGMTRDQVEEILGGPARQEGGIPVMISVDDGWKEWVSEYGIVVVWFDKADRVYKKEFFENPGKPPSLFSKLRANLPW
jgi:hypothetical protein